MEIVQILVYTYQMLLSLGTLTFTSATISVFLLFFLILKLTKKNITRAAPEAAGAWPIIGHLHLLGGSELLHKTLGFMADKYGPIFTINIGAHQALVVSNSNIAKECLTTNDKVFASRPKSLAAEIMSYNYAMFGFGPYGSYWRQMRRTVMHELLSNSRLEILGEIRVSEIKVSVKIIYELWIKKKDASNTVKMDMKEWFESLILKMVVRILFGEWYSCNEEDYFKYQKSMRKFIEMFGIFVVSDAIPFLRWLDLGGYEKTMKKTAEDIDYILESWLQEHKRKRSSGQVRDDQQDFMGVMLSILESAADEDLAGFDADTVNKATCLNLLSAGTDTAAITLTWALSLLLNNRHVLKRAQDELDVHVGRERQVEDSDIKNLVYLQAIIKETFRLYPPVPLSAPHESTADSMVAGYHIPKGTRLIVNLFKIHRDPQIWPDPNEFKPERFLTSHKEIDVWGKHFELIPFGSGRRMCPGISLGLQILHLTLASLIHGFEFANPLNEAIDMSESIGLTNCKASPIEVLITPRLSPNMYG